MFTITENNYDIALAQDYFNEFKLELESNDSGLFLGKRQLDYLVISDDLNEPYYTKEDLYDKPKNELLSICDYFDVYIDEQSSKAEIIDEIISLVSVGYYHSKVYDNDGWHGVEYDYIVSGYCQGDAVKVLIISNNFNWITKEYLTNLFYDTPISYGTISFLNEIIYLDDYANSFYEYNLNEIINNFENNYKGWYKSRILEIIKSMDAPKY